jgi:hypothetical protein
VRGESSTVQGKTPADETDLGRLHLHHVDCPCQHAVSSAAAQQSGAIRRVQILHTQQHRGQPCCSSAETALDGTFSISTQASSGAKRSRTMVLYYIRDIRRRMPYSSFCPSLKSTSLYHQQARDLMLPSNLRSATSSSDLQGVSRGVWNLIMAGEYLSFNIIG